MDDGLGTARASTPVMGSVVSIDPIVTISKITKPAPMGIASVLPEVFSGRPALHLVSNTKNSEKPSRAKKIRGQLDEVSAKLESNRFVFLANTSFECLALQRTGIPTFASSELISLDEDVFRITDRRLEGLGVHDSIYVARLTHRKRHDLVSGLGSVMLVYGSRGGEAKEYTRLQEALPKATFVNHLVGNGEYRRLGKDEIAVVNNMADVGLCLSREEGAMRASMEYLMCGLPVVSTPNIGGRNRYFDSRNCVFADPTPEGVALAVDAMKSRRPDREEVRDTVLDKVEFDRRDFLSTVNHIIESFFGVADLFESYTPFLGYMKYRPACEIVSGLLRTESGTTAQEV